MSIRTALVVALWSISVLAGSLCRASSLSGDGVVLSMSKGPGAGEVQLSWSGGSPVYGVFRDTTPLAVRGPANLLGQTGASSFSETPPPSPLVFYVVTNPPCATGADCLSGHCVDGVCCESACTGACQTCNQAAALGTCAPIPAGMEPGAECDVVCATLPPLPSGTCAVTGGGSDTLLVGTVLGSPEVYIGGQVLVDASGTITCVGCGCAAGAPSATVITCPTGVIAPGLINSLDFLTFTQNFPHVDTGERYEHRHEWRVGLNGHTSISASGAATVNQQRWGELRHLMGGTTSLVGSGSSAGLLRNLSVLARQEGLNQTPPVLQTFPLGDSSGVLLSSGCAYPAIRTAAEVATFESYHATVAEGISTAARNEFACLSSSANGGQDLVQPQSTFRHAIGVTAGDLAAMASDGTGLIWSPRSNLSLYGDTTPVAAASRAGVVVALGTDWIVSGSMSLQRELSCARSFNQTYLHAFFTDAELLAMATRNAAELTATDDVIGTLSIGKIADIAVFDAASFARHRAVVSSSPPEVALVLRGGTALYGDAAVVAALRGSGCDAVEVCGRAKQVCVQAEIGMTLAQLETSVGSIYPAFSCGPPADEPTCIPTRSASVSGSTVYTGATTLDDPDGDGIVVGDNCPLVFNPVRPLDGGSQADADGDGAGDACDPCPTTTLCPP